MHWTPTIEHELARFLKCSHREKVSVSTSEKHVLIEFDSESATATALAKNGIEYNGRKLKIELVSNGNVSAVVTTTSWISQVKVSLMTASTVRISNISEGIVESDLVNLCKEFGMIKSITGSLSSESKGASRRFVIVEFADSASADRLLSQFQSQVENAGVTAAATEVAIVSEAYLAAYYSSELLKTAEAIDLRARKEYDELHKVWIETLAQNVKWEQARVDLETIEWEQNLIDQQIKLIDDDVDCFLKNDRFVYEIEGDQLR